MFRKNVGRQSGRRLMRFEGHTFQFIELYALRLVRLIFLGTRAKTLQNVVLFPS